MKLQYFVVDEIGQVIAWFFSAERAEQYARFLRGEGISATAHKSKNGI